MGNIKNLKMKSFTTQTILATLAYSVLTVNGLNVQRGIMSAIQQDVAKLGETCGGHNEVTGRPFADCADGLVCQSTFGVGIPGTHNVCMKPLAGKGETC